MSVNVSNDFNSESKLFADNASLFSVVHDINISASDLNDSSETINQWAFQWKTNPNSDPNKRRQEIVFSSKKCLSPSNF